jgi:hypothetical protein
MNRAAAGRGVIKSRRAATKGKSVPDAESVPTYVRNNPGSSGEQIASAAGTDTTTLRPVLRELISAGAVTTTGKGRGTRYAATVRDRVIRSTRRPAKLVHLVGVS